MIHPIALGAQFADVVFGRRRLQRQPPRHRDPVVFQARLFGRVVAERPNRPNAQIGQHLRTCRIPPGIDRQTECEIRFDRIGATIR